MEELVACDLEFHEGVVQSSGNSVLCSLLDGLSGPTTRARIWRGLTQEDAVSRTLHEHRAILSALRDRDAEAAATSATVHIASVEQWLRSTLWENSSDDWGVVHGGDRACFRPLGGAVIRHCPVKGAGRPPGHAVRLGRT